MREGAASGTKCITAALGSCLPVSSSPAPASSRYPGLQLGREGSKPAASRKVAVVAKEERGCGSPVPVPWARRLHQGRLSRHPDFSITLTPTDPSSWGFDANLNIEKNLLPFVVFFQKEEVGNTVRKGVRWTKPNTWKRPQLPSTEGKLLLALFHIFHSKEMFFPLVSSHGTAEIKRVSGLYISASGAAQSPLLKMQVTALFPFST